MVRWIIDEGFHKTKRQIRESQCKRISQHLRTPQQLNGNDCGVFTIVCADFLSDDLPIIESSYNQTEMDFFRMKIGTDMIRGKLQYPLI